MSWPGEEGGLGERMQDKGESRKNEAVNSNGSKKVLVLEQPIILLYQTVDESCFL